jgi:Glycosyltransferase family 87
MSTKPLEAARVASPSQQGAFGQTVICSRLTLSGHVGQPSVPFPEPTERLSRPPGLSSKGRKALVALVGVSIVIYALNGLVAVQAPYRFDLAINYSAATVLRTGAGSIYDMSALQRAHRQRIGDSPVYDPLYKGLYTSYINPPTTAILLLPLSILPFHAATVFFLLLSNGLYLGSILLLLRALRTPLGSPAGLVALICALPFYPLFVSFFLGQMDGFVVFGLLLALLAALERHDARAGAWITMTAAIKVSPVLLLGFFVARRRWSAVVAALTVGLLVFCAELLVVGPHTLLYFATRILPLVGKGSAFFENQSLLGMIYRWVAPASEVWSLDAAGNYPIARAIWASSSLLILAVSFALVRRARLDRRALATVGLGVFIVAGVLSGAISWDHYTIWTLLPLIALAIEWFDSRWLRGRVFWPVFAVVWTAINFPAVLQLALYARLGPIASSFGTYGLLGALALMWCRLGHARAATGAQPAPLT